MKSNSEPDHADVASVLNNPRGVLYQTNRPYTEVVELHLRALTIREKLHPPPIADIAQSKCNLAVVYHSRGRSREEPAINSLKGWNSWKISRPKITILLVSNYADLSRSLGQYVKRINWRRKISCRKKRSS